MAEAKDPAIKLFGKTIALPDSSSRPGDVIPEELASSSNDNDNNNHVGGDVSDDGAPLCLDIDNNNNNKDDQDGNICLVKQSGVSPDRNACQDAPSGITDNPDALSGADDNAAAAPSKPEEEKKETNVSQDKVLKKPDKILPCPRCNSMDTKFCYYNNYNVNQPRHFCKNCQRYWTAGGTMRNVPVGAGRRKNKSSSSHFRHVAIPEALQSARPDIANGVHPGLPANGTVLTFGSDAPLCESMASILNIAEKTTRNCAPNGFQQPDELKIPIPVVAMETGCNQLDRSNSKDDANKSGQKETASQNCLPFPPQFPCYPGAPWPCPWNSAQWSPPLAAPPFYPNGIALPYYPAPAYWGCTVPGTWSVPLIRQPSPQGQSSPSSGPNSPTLGKHTRDGNVLTNTEQKESEDNSSEPSLWIPKTLRIDDPGEAAKSSIWTTLGIKNSEKPDTIGCGSGLFKAFQSQCNDKGPKAETSLVLEANPAALSRSQDFQENS